MGTPASVGVDDDLTTGKTGVAVGTTDDEAARGVQVVDGVGIKVLGGNDGLNDVLVKVLLDLLLRDTLAVLCGDDYGVHTDGNGLAVVHAVLTGDLGLAIGAHPGALAGLADLG